MGSGFSPQTEVLMFPWSWPRGAERRVSLLWPALVYRVVAPRPRQQRLNLLERAVVSLCRVGLRRADEIAPRLHIERDLAAHIARDLQDRGALDELGQLTDTGERLWLSELEVGGDLQVCHAFQDVESGRLWPFLARDLPYAERRMLDSGYPVVIKGTSGKPREDRPFVVLPAGAGWPDPPDVDDLVQASRQHGRRRRSWAEDDEDGAEDLEADEREPAEPDGAGRGAARRAGVAGHEELQRVALIEEQGRPVLLMTFAYLPSGPAAGAGLRVCDPFTGQQSASMLERVRQRARPSALHDRLRRLLEQEEPAQREHAQRREAADRAEAEQEVEERFGRGVHDSALYRRLGMVAQAARDHERLGADAPEFRRALPLAEVRKALEQGVAELSRDAPLRGVHRAVFQGAQPHPDRAFVQQIYEEAARQVGFMVPLPPALAEVEPLQLCHACGARGAWRLRPRLMATLLCAAGAPDHPLRRAAQGEPRLLHRLDDLMRRCSEAVHGQAPRSAGVAEVLAEAWAVLQILVEVGA